jgi:hypothetical protein
MKMVAMKLGTLGQRLGVLLFLPFLRRHWSLRWTHLISSLILWRLSDEWMSMGNHLGHLAGCIYVLGVPWGVLHLALHEILLGREANLVSIKSASSRFSWFAALPWRHHISHVRTPNNEIRCPGCVPRNYLQLWYLFLSLETKIRSPKSALEDNLFWFRTDCTAGITGAISPSSLIRIWPSTCPNQRYHRDPQLW